MNYLPFISINNKYCECLQENYGLKSLLVAMNGFSEMGAEALGRALKHNRGLTELDVSHNRINETGAGHIALGLQTNDVLKELRVGTQILNTRFINTTWYT